VTERRRWLRFETALNTLCEFVNEKRNASSKIKNISKEGALLVLDKPLKEGEELNLAVDIPGDNIPIFASCQVAWQEELAQKKEYATGVKFTKMDGSDKGRLLEYIYSQWLRLLDKKD
jgi:c-di-GMP-binding flagellar brake protein YcgR